MHLQKDAFGSKDNYSGSNAYSTDSSQHHLSSARQTSTFLSIEVRFWGFPTASQPLNAYLLPEDKNKNHV